ncbi:MAG: helix-turn-helix transcriptional regulator [Muribaculaceae bacterium]|nr:helix-turn-helix transcriptional regulator [Muribaculaceae bacterium]
MNLSQITSSQFADTCNIPRPTISQILNGRNKKISDEIISKIHSSYPTLSMLWLMFGEGDMLINRNIEISGEQNQLNQSESVQQSTDNNLFTSSLDIDFNCTENISEKLDIDFLDKKTQAQPSISKNSNNTKQLSLSPDSSKTIVNIMVFYSDNSFESFTPANRKI